MSSIMRQLSSRKLPEVCWFPSETGSKPYSEVILDDDSLVKTQRGLVRVADLRGSDVVTLEVKAYMVKGLVRHKE